jgi:hypothetical protein
MEYYPMAHSLKFGLDGVMSGEMPAGRQEAIEKTLVF